MITMGKSRNKAVLSLEIPWAFANYIRMFDNMSSSTILISFTISIYCIVQREDNKLDFLCLFLIYIARLIWIMLPPKLSVATPIRVLRTRLYCYNRRVYLHYIGYMTWLLPTPSLPLRYNNSWSSIFTQFDINILVKLWNIFSIINLYIIFIGNFWLIILQKLIGSSQGPWFILNWKTSIVSFWN